MKFEALKDDYARLYATMEVRPERRVAIDKAARRIISDRARYEDIASRTGVPWYLVGVIHHLECGGSWEKHLHNGDPLCARTIQVPRNRPKGTPPFTWEDSACDALAYDKLDQVTEWSLPRMAFELEKYNGFGYRPKGIASPYLWSFTNHYRAGKYVADRKWSATAVSAQAGAMPILRRVDELCKDVDLNIIEPDPTREFTRCRPEREAPSSMARSSEGNAAIATGGIGSSIGANEVAVAVGKAAASPKGFSLSEFLLQLATSPAFWAGVSIVGFAAYMWIRRRGWLIQGK